MSTLVRTAEKGYFYDDEKASVKETNKGTTDSTSKPKLFFRVKAFLLN
jgi:hypothetical protein